MSKIGQHIGTREALLEKAKQIEEWQNGPFHPLTCRNNSSHILQAKIKPIEHSEEVQLILCCPKCPYIQKDIPDVLFSADSKKYIEQHKGFWESLLKGAKAK